MSLTLRQSAILELRKETNTHRQFTLKEIGNLFDVTKERIRQIEGKAN